jgi:hypothetical protein
LVVVVVVVVVVARSPTKQASKQASKQARRAVRKSRKVEQSKSSRSRSLVATGFKQANKCIMIPRRIVNTVERVPLVFNIGTDEAFRLVTSTYCSLFK